MTEKRIPKKEVENMQTWCVPVLGASGALLPSHEKQLKDGKSENIQHLSAYVQNGRLTSEVLEKLHQQIYEEGLAKGQAEGYKSGHEKGFEKGSQNGYQAGYLEGKGKAEQEFTRLRELFDRLFQPLQDQEERVEHWMLQSVKAICLGILQRECVMDSTVLLPFVKEAVASLPVSINKISITLNPEDITLIQDYSAQKSLHWNLLSDSEMSRGDCRITNDSAAIDYTLSARVEQALSSIVSSQIVVDNNDASLHH